MDHRELIHEAIRIAGTQQKLADAIGVSQQRISHIIRLSKRVPAEVAVKIDRFTDGKVSKTALRPDIFSEGEG
jgi:DNA-binding transcriptional regulator YdaS (Cro superfamily)